MSGMREKQMRHKRKEKVIATRPTLCFRLKNKHTHTPHSLGTIILDNRMKESKSRIFRLGVLKL